MSERGVFAVDRGIFDHPVFADEPFTEREAWQWLISEASFRDRKRNVSGRIVALKRGQLSASVRFMADRWKWGKSSVERFLQKLRNEAMVGTDSGTGILVITISNYARYQRVAMPDGTENGTQTGTVAGQLRDKTESTESIEGREIDARATGKSLATEGSGKLASAFLNALGFSTPLSVPPEFAGVPWKAMEWEKLGYSAEMIAAEAVRIGPGKPLSYHEKVFKSAHESAKAPASSRTNHGKPQGIIQAADRLIDTIASFDAGPGDLERLRGAESAAHVRLLSQG